MIEVDDNFHIKAQGQVINPIAGIYISYAKNRPKANIIPEEYQEVDYIESSGTQYIDTGYVPNHNTRIKTTFNRKNISPYQFTALCGSRDNNSGGDGFSIFRNDTSGVLFVDLFGTRNPNIGSISYDTWNTLDLSTTTAILNGASTSLSSGSGSLSRNMRLFALDSVGVISSYSWKIKTFSIYDNDTLVRNFIPCYRKSDNVVGMYDLANSGKNLFNLYAESTQYPGSSQQLLVTKNNGVLTLKALGTNGAQYAEIKGRCSQNTQYTISVKCKKIVPNQDGDNSVAVLPRYSNDGINWTYDWGNRIQISSPVTGQEYSLSKTFTTGNYTYLNFLFYNAQGTPVTIGAQTEYYDIQFEKGSTATEYEPYPFYTNAGTGTFTKGNDVGYTTSYFTLDQSRLDGVDILDSNSTNPIQLWDTYEYIEYTDRLVSVDVSRSIEYPYSTQSAQADFVLDNYDKYFTPGAGSIIDEYNLPGRPLRIYGGFNGASMIPQFVGLTKGMPSTSEKTAKATYHALDFLSEIANQTLSSTIDMRDARTNEVLAKIVEQFGVLPSQYNFEQGDNVIPFVFFDIGQNAGEAIRKLVQAEGGKFWLDEMGILRFQKRYTMQQDPVINLTEYSIINVTPSNESEIVNHVKITCDLREVQEYQTVYEKNSSGNSISSNLWVVPAGGSIVRECNLQDPCYDVVTPTLGRATSVSWFTAKNALGEEITSAIYASGTLSTNAYTITFQNDNLFDVEIDEVTLWGEPAKVYDVLDYDAYEDESVEKYGEHILQITDNQFFQSYDQAQGFGVYMLRDRAFYQSVLTLDVKGDFSLQLGDTITLQGEWAGTYKIDAINWHLEAGNYTTQIKIHKFTPVDYFTLDNSQLDGTDVLA